MLTYRRRELYRRDEDSTSGPRTSAAPSSAFRRPKRSSGSTRPRSWLGRGQGRREAGAVPDRRPRSARTGLSARPQAQEGRHGRQGHRDQVRV